MRLIKRVPLLEFEKENQVKSFKKFTLDDIKSFKRAKFKKIYVKKYYARMLAVSPVSKINNKAVELALAEEYTEAKILLLEVIKERKNEGAAYNNLGIIFEISGISTKAGEMYSKACQLNSKNKVVKKNFKLFQDYNKRKTKGDEGAFLGIPFRLIIAH